MLKNLKEQADKRAGAPKGAATVNDTNSSADARAGGSAGSQDKRAGGNAGGSAGSQDKRAGGNPATVTSDVFACLLNSKETDTQPKIVKTSSPNQVRQVFSDVIFYFFSNYYFQFTDKTGKFDKTKHYKGTWKCDGDKDYIINTEDGDDYSSKRGNWKGVPNNSNNNNNNNNNNNTGLVDTTLTGDELKAGKVVKIGMKGSIVGTIQDLLIKLGYTNVSSSGEKDNKFGRRTKQMVKDFQTNNGLTDDGEVGKDTWPKLNDPAAVKNSASSTSSLSGSAKTSVAKDGETVAGSDVIIVNEKLKKTLRENLLKFN